MSAPTSPHPSDFQAAQDRNGPEDPVKCPATGEKEGQRLQPGWGGGGGEGSPQMWQLWWGRRGVEQQMGRRGPGRDGGWLDHSAPSQPGHGLQASHFLCLNEGSRQCLPTTAASSPCGVGGSTAPRWSRSGTKSPAEHTVFCSHHRRTLRLRHTEHQLQQCSPHPTGARTGHSCASLLVKCHYHYLQEEAGGVGGGVKKKTGPEDFQEL